MTLSKYLATYGHYYIYIVIKVGPSNTRRLSHIFMVEEIEFHSFVFCISKLAGI